MPCGRVSRSNSTKPSLCSSTAYGSAEKGQACVNLRVRLAMLVGQSLKAWSGLEVSIGDGEAAMVTRSKRTRTSHPRLTQDDTEPWSVIAEHARLTKTVLETYGTKPTFEEFMTREKNHGNQSLSAPGLPYPLFHNATRGRQQIER
jgi:hypothetical protein